MPFIKLDVGTLDSSIWTDDLGFKMLMGVSMKAVPILFEAAVEVLDPMTMKPAGWSVPPGWYGFARVSGPWIARQCRMGSEEERTAAFVRLCSPEEESRSKEFEGRRIARVNGGYVVLNFMKYRDFDYGAADRMRLLRARKKASSVTPNGATVTPNTRTVTPNCDVEQRAESRDRDIRTTEQPSSASALAKVTPVEVEVISWSRAACDDWIARFGGTAPGGQIGKALIPIVKRHGWEFVRRAWCRYLAQAEAQYASPARFSATFGRWSGLAPDPAPLDDATAHNARVLADYMRNRQDGDLGGVVKSMPKLRG